MRRGSSVADDVIDAEDLKVAHERADLAEAEANREEVFLKEEKEPSWLTRAYSSMIIGHHGHAPIGDEDSVPADPYAEKITAPDDNREHGSFDERLEEPVDGAHPAQIRSASTTDGMPDWLKDSETTDALKQASLEVMSLADEMSAVPLERQCHRGKASPSRRCSPARSPPKRNSEVPRRSCFALPVVDITAPLARTLDGLSELLGLSR